MKRCIIFILFFGLAISFKTLGQTTQQNYANYCGVCHGTNIEEGKVNSLVKKDWKQGGSKKAIIKSISEGIPNTQMIAWKAVLSKKEIEELADYIISVQKAKPSKKN